MENIRGVTGPELSESIKRGSNGQTDLVIVDDETEQVIEERIIPTGMELPRPGDIVSTADVSITGKRRSESEVEVADDANEPYEVVARRLNYDFFDVDIEEEDLEEATGVTAVVWVVEIAFEEPA